MNANLATKAYAKIGVESSVIAADPHKLISMLYQGALQAIANAKGGMIRIADTKKNKSSKRGLTKEIADKCAAISKAVAIIDDGLNASLDKKVGGELAQNLSSLYDYMCKRLVVANLKNDTAILDEVAHLLNDLKNAWEAMRSRSAASAPVVSPIVAKVPSVETAPVAPAQSQVKAAAKPADLKAVAQPTVAAVVPLVTPQQRVANKVQMLYGKG